MKRLCCLSLAVVFATSAVRADDTNRNEETETPESQTLVVAEEEGKDEDKPDREKPDQRELRGRDVREILKKARELHQQGKHDEATELLKDRLPPRMAERFSRMHQDGPGRDDEPGGFGRGPRREGAFRRGRQAANDRKVDDDDGARGPRDEDRDRRARDDRRGKRQDARDDQRPRRNSKDGDRARAGRRHRPHPGRYARGRGPGRPSFGPPRRGMEHGRHMDWHTDHARRGHEFQFARAHGRSRGAASRRDGQRVGRELRELRKEIQALRELVEKLTNATNDA